MITSLHDILHCAEAAGFKVSYTHRTIESNEANVTDRLITLISMLDKQYSTYIEACACPDSIIKEDLSQASSLEAFEKWWKQDEFDHDIQSGSTRLLDFNDDTPMKYYTRLAWEAARKFLQAKGGFGDLDGT